MLNAVVSRYKMPKRDYQKCAVSGCSSRGSDKNIKYYMFPTNKTLCEKWVLKIKNPQLEDRSLQFIRRNYAVCKKHFEASMFQTTEKLKLNRGAIPTLFAEQEQLANVRSSTSGNYFILFIYMYVCTAWHEVYLMLATFIFGFRPIFFYKSCGC